VLRVVLDARGLVPADSVAALVNAAVASDAQLAIADTLTSNPGTGRRAIWLGALALRHSAYADLRALARELALATGASFGELLEGANAVGAYIAGAVPHRLPGGAPRAQAGLDARRLLAQPQPAYLLLGTEPWADGLEGAALATLKAARFVAAVTPYASAALLECAHVLLPAGPFAETSGTFVNLEGRWQSFAAAARAQGGSRPAWKVLRVLGNLLDLQGFEYQSSEQVRDELKAAFESVPRAAPAAGFVASASAHVEPLRDVPMYQLDAVLRRSAPLQQTRAGQAVAVDFAP